MEMVVGGVKNVITNIFIKKVVSKASHRKGYPIRRPKDYERDLLQELLEQERIKKLREEKEIRVTRKDIDLRTGL
jgi:rRNA pseudouridine-1189 N-methylase Emg1 (Nep1/Mra1 family)